MSLYHQILTGLRPRNWPFEGSLIYFKWIKEEGSLGYTAEFVHATNNELLDDLARQIHRNAEIAEAKHWGAFRSTQFGFAGAVLLLCAAVALLH